MAISWSSLVRWAYPQIFAPQVGIQTLSGGTYANESGQSVSEVRALSIGAAFRCIRIIAEVAGALPMRAYSGTRDGDRTFLPDSHWLTSIVEEPNPIMSGDEWREAEFAQMAGWGNGYSQIVPNAAGRATELWPYTVDKMTVNRRKDLLLDYQYPDVNGKLQPLTMTQVLHLRSFSLDGVMGISPLTMARETLGLTVGADRYAASFYAQGGRPAITLTSDKLLNDKQREQIRREYGGISDMTPEEARSVQNQTGKRMWLLEAGLKVSPITVSPDDMQMLQTRSFQISEVARFFGVPLFLLMENSKDTSWGTGLEQMNLGFLTYTLRPYLQRMVTVFNRRIIPADQRGKIFVDIDDSPLLTMDSNALKEVYGSYASNAIMTRNEIRRKLKLPRSEQKNADGLTAQVALTPLDRLGMTAPPGTLPPGQKDAPT